MALAENITPLKAVSTFAIIILLLIWGGGLGIGVIKAMKTGDWKSGLTETGGRIFAIDSILNKEVTYLLQTDEKITSYDRVFHIAYSLCLLFVLFFFAFLLFKLMNWMVGIKAFSPSSDIFIIALIILIFLGLQFLYTYLILGEAIVPLSGIWNFVYNLPKMINIML